MSKKVIKRSGKKVEYNVQKIIDAIGNVFKEFDNYNEQEVGILAHKVDKKLMIDYFGEDDEPHVEQIQDMVEDVLMLSGFKNEAKAYIRYRERHAQKRKEWLKGEQPLNVWIKKYQFNSESFEEFFDRVTRGNEIARRLLKQKILFPAGRILANRLLYKYGIKVTYSNCYTGVSPKDDLFDIILTAAKMARTFSYGGGSGNDLSNLRPKGARVNNAAKTTSGPVSFLDIYDVISEKVGQKGRRAALMLTMIVTHPDIMDFIDKKADISAVNKANMSVKVTNQFMEAVKNNGDFKLHFHVDDTGEDIEKIVDANKIMNKIAYGNWNVGDPGVLFWDRVNNWCLISEDDEVVYETTNPCGEEPLLPGGSCLLGAVNLANLVENPYTDKARFNMGKFKDVVQEGVKYLDEVLEEGLPLHPLDSQKECVRNWRQIGLGPLGLASMFIKLGIRYGSQESLSLIDEIGFTMINAALQQSALLAKEKGAYPKYKEEAVLRSPFLHQNATTETFNMVKNYGLRNSQLLTTAPTGSIHQLAQVSSGIEPIFAIDYTRRTESLHGEDREYTVFQPTVRELMEAKKIDKKENLPDYVISAHDINYKDRIEMQSVWQQYIDASISSTINVSNDTTVGEIKEIYIHAWEQGLKGITLFRAGCKKEAILKSKDKVEGEKQEMTRQDFIDQGICPDCKANLVNKTGCRECLSCGFQVCSV